MIGICLVEGSCFSTWVASQPSMIGMEISIRIKSGCSERALAIPSSPFSASVTSHGYCWVGFRANFLPSPELGSYVQFSQPAQTGFVDSEGASSRIDSPAQIGWTPPRDSTRLEQHRSVYHWYCRWGDSGSDSSAISRSGEWGGDKASHRPPGAE